MDGFQGQLTMAAYGAALPADHEHRTQILGRFNVYTLYTWDLYCPHVGFALFFLQFSENYCRVKKLERIVNGLSDARYVIFLKMNNFISKIQIVFKKNCLVQLSLIEKKLLKSQSPFLNYVLSDIHHSKEEQARLSF